MCLPTDPVCMYVDRCRLRPDDSDVSRRLLLRGPDGAHRVLFLRVVLVGAAVDGVRPELGRPEPLCRPHHQPVPADQQRYHGLHRDVLPVSARRAVTCQPRRLLWGALRREILPPPGEWFLKIAWVLTLSIFPVCQTRIPGVEHRQGSCFYAVSLPPSQFFFIR